MKERQKIYVREISYKIKFNKELIEKLEKEIVQSFEELSVYDKVL